MRSNAAVYKRLQRIEQQRHNAVVKPVAMWGELLGVDAWGAIAVVAQERLKEHVKSDEDGRCDYSDLQEMQLVPKTQIRL